jgi:hypothetical protein
MAHDQGAVGMALYDKSRLFMVWIFILFLSFPLWITLLRGMFGEAGVIAGMVFWLGHGGAALYLFRCPDCGVSPFLSRKGLLKWSTPWPRKICGHCGHDHRMAR